VGVRGKAATGGTGGIEVKVGRQTRYARARHWNDPLLVTLTPACCVVLCVGPGSPEAALRIGKTPEQRAAEKKAADDKVLPTPAPDCSVPLADLLCPALRVCV
jgi:hypothetical protein